MIGDASVDHFVRVPHIAGHDNKAIGQLVGIYGGGMSANVAAAAAVQRVPVELVTKTGVGPQTDAVYRELVSYGVELRRSVRDPERATWMCFVQLDPTGEKALVGADTGIKVPEVTEIHPGVFADADYVMPLADDLVWAAELAELATAAGCRTAIDLEPDAFEPEQEELRRLLGHTDVVFLNGAAAQKWAPDPLHAARAIHALGPLEVVVSSGAAGALHSDADGRVHRAQCTDPVQAVDTTGAGDALAGAFLGSRLGGADPAKSLQRAVAHATSCVLHIGSRTYLEHLPQNQPTIDVTTERAPA